MGESSLDAPTIRSAVALEAIDGNEMSETIQSTADFIAAADESEAGNQEGPFLFGGYVAPVSDWEQWFAPAWQERVLGAPPKLVLPFFHMADIASPEGRSKCGLTERDASSRLRAAVDVIRSTGSLHFTHAILDGHHFRRLVDSIRLVQQGTKQWGSYRFEPDYIAFLGFAFGALRHVHDEYPAANKVDFVVERKQPVTHHLREFHRDMASSLINAGHDDLVPLVGRLIPAGKERIPLQAADLCLWHLRRLEAGDATNEDLRRLEEMSHGRLRTAMSLTHEYVEGLIARSRPEAVKHIPRKPKKGSASKGFNG